MAHDRRFTAANLKSQAPNNKQIMFGIWNLIIGICRRKATDMGEAYPEVTPSFFAEFLNKGSPVHLSILNPSTCVGLRYEYDKVSS